MDKRRFVVPSDIDSRKIRRSKLIYRGKGTANDPIDLSGRDFYQNKKIRRIFRNANTDSIRRGHSIECSNRASDKYFSEAQRFPTLAGNGQLNGTVFTADNFPLLGYRGNNPFNGVVPYAGVNLHDVIMSRELDGDRHAAQNIQNWYRQLKAKRLVEHEKRMKGLYSVVGGLRHVTADAGASGRHPLPLQLMFGGQLGSKLRRRGVHHNYVERKPKFVITPEYRAVV